MRELTTRDLVEQVEELYPPRLAQEWDQIGLVCGRLDQPVTGVLVAVDLTAAVVAEAIARQANFILVHHPLFLSGVHEVSEEQFKGELVHDLIENKLSLMVAHTNADAARPGVSDALAGGLGLLDTLPLEPDVENAAVGVGRVGILSNPMTLREFADLVAASTPGTAQGVRVTGDPDAEVSRVAVCGGSGDSYLGLVQSLGADVYVTSDLKHHRLRDHVDAGGCAVIDIPHWASEFPWCAVAASQLGQELAEVAPHTSVSVYEGSTDPWVFHLGSSSTA